MARFRFDGAFPFQWRVSVSMARFRFMDGSGVKTMA